MQQSPKGCVYILQISAKHDDATNLCTLDLWPILDDTIHTWITMKHAIIAYPLPKVVLL